MKNWFLIVVRRSEVADHGSLFAYKPHAIRSCHDFALPCCRDYTGGARTARNPSPGLFRNGLHVNLVWLPYFKQPASLSWPSTGAMLVPCSDPRPCASSSCLLTTKLTGGNRARRNCRSAEHLVGDVHFANTNNEYPPNTLAVNSTLNFEHSHRGTLATAVLIDGCCLKVPNARLV